MKTLLFFAVFLAVIAGGGWYTLHKTGVDVAELTGSDSLGSIFEKIPEGLSHWLGFLTGESRKPQTPTAAQQGTPKPLGSVTSLYGERFGDGVSFFQEIDAPGAQFSWNPYPLNRRLTNLEGVEIVAEILGREANQVRFRRADYGDREFKVAFAQLAPSTVEMLKQLPEFSHRDEAYLEAKKRQAKDLLIEIEEMRREAADVRVSEAERRRATELVESMVQDLKDVEMDIAEIRIGLQRFAINP